MKCPMLFSSCFSPISLTSLCLSSFSLKTKDVKSFFNDLFFCSNYFSDNPKLRLKIHEIVPTGKYTLKLRNNFPSIEFNDYIYRRNIL